MADTTVLLSNKNILLKKSDSGWGVVLTNSESIKDVIDSQFGQFAGLFVISENKVIKWSTFVPQKKIYLRVQDEAGNISDTKDCSVVSLDLKSIKAFTPSARILDIDEYGNVTYSYDSPEGNLFYGGNLIDIETGVYESEIFNGTNDLVSWRTITWNTIEPKNTEVHIQIRSGDSTDSIVDEDWSDNLEKDAQGFANIDFITKQFIQFRAILQSRVKDVSPTLNFVTIQNLTSRATHFFTTNFILSSRVKSGLLTDNSVIPVNADIVWGINTKNSTDFSDYQIIEPNRIFTTDSTQFGNNLRIGIKLIAPGNSLLSSDDPYNQETHICSVNFDFKNATSVEKPFDFRVRFYSDVNRTQLSKTFFSGSDQTGWTYSGNIDFPSTGVTLGANDTITITFVPGTGINSQQAWYLSIDAFDGSDFIPISSDTTYVCSNCSEYQPYCTDNIPYVKNFAIVFALDNGEQVQLNI